MNRSAEIGELISRVALGDNAAFKQLYDRTSAKLFGICLRILNDRAEAEDVLQEVYVRVWHKADRYASGKATGITWLSAVARNLAIDRYRSRKPENDDIDEMDHIEDDGPSPEASTLAGDENRQMSDCLDELDPKHANAVRKTYLSGWTYQEAADELTVPLNTVRTWIRRSLLALRDCMNR